MSEIESLCFAQILLKIRIFLQNVTFWQIALGYYGSHNVDICYSNFFQHLKKKKNWHKRVKVSKSRTLLKKSGTAHSQIPLPPHPQGCNWFAGFLGGRREPAPTFLVLARMMMKPRPTSFPIRSLLGCVMGPSQDQSSRNTWSCTCAVRSRPWFIRKLQPASQSNMLAAVVRRMGCRTTTLDPIDW